MDVDVSSESWAHEVFGRVDLGDKRHDRRLIAMAAAVAIFPAGKVTEVFRKPAELEAVYRFVENENVDPVRFACTDVRDGASTVVQHEREARRAGGVAGTPVGAATSMIADWYFDFVSPFAYLQSEQLASLGPGVAVRYRPVLFAGLLGANGQKGPAEIPAKRTFTYRYCIWRAQELGIGFRFPPEHPFNPLPLLARDRLRFDA